MTVKISPGNSKMGAVPSVSLPAYVTCRHDCDCCRQCYARKLERIRKSVREAYASNYRLLQEDPAIYWREVEASVMLSRFFRFHVSGDIPDADYFRHMVSIARMNFHCEILCFTKRFSIVNDYLRESGGVLPQNLHIIFSGWKGLEMDNPFRLPEAHVLYRDGTTTASPGYITCPGNCASCAVTNSGCWTLLPGQQIAFHEH